VPLDGPLAPIVQIAEYDENDVPIRMKIFINPADI